MTVRYKFTLSTLVYEQVSVMFPGNDSRVHFCAARDIDPGEQLCISYIAEGLPRAVRQERLAFAYGFECACELCKEELELRA